MRKMHDSTDHETISRGKLWLSRFGVLGAAALLALTCSTCCPRLTAAVRRIVVVHSDWPSEYWQTLDAKFEEAFSALPGCVFSRALIPPGKEREFFFGRLNRELGDVALLTYAFSDCTQQDVARLLSCEIPLVFLENHISCDGVNAIDSE